MTEHDWRTAIAASHGLMPDFIARTVEEAKFGNKVAKIVEGCTDSFVEYPDKKQEWEERKSSYIERL